MHAARVSRGWFRIARIVFEMSLFSLACRGGFASASLQRALVSEMRRAQEI